MAYPTITKHTNYAKKGNLKEMQEFVGGYIEYIRLPNGDTMIVNEEARLLDLEINREASIIYYEATGLPKAILGNVIVLHKKNKKA